LENDGPTGRVPVGGREGMGLGMDGLPETRTGPLRGSGTGPTYNSDLRRAIDPTHTTRILSTLVG